MHIYFDNRTLYNSPWEEEVRLAIKGLVENQNVALGQSFATFLMPRTFNIVPLAMSAPTIQLFSMMLPNCGFSVSVYCSNRNANTCVFQWSWATPMKGLFDLRGVTTNKLRTTALGVCY